MSEYVDFHYMPLEGKITGKQVLKQTEDAINDLGEHVYELDIDESRIDEAVEKSEQAIETAESALSAVTTDRAVWKNTVAEMKATDIDLGVTAATRGKMVFNDGNGAFYGVRSEKSGDVESDDTVFLNNGNVAERIQSMNIIAKGNNIIYVANVAELIDSDALIGNVYGTTGYYSANDGGAGLYSIRTKTQSDVDDGGSIIFLDNGNVAELITDGTVNVKQYGIMPTDTTTDALSKINAILSLNKWHNIIIPSDINYGYNRHYPNTYTPNVYACTIRVTVWDYSVDNSYNVGGEEGTNGNQIRIWSNTPNADDGRHDGNGVILGGNHHPYIFISNDGDPSVEKRASITFGTKLTINWMVGQGIYNNDENFRIDNGQTTFFAIAKDTGNIGIGTNYLSRPLSIGRKPYIASGTEEKLILADSLVGATVSNSFWSNATELRLNNNLLTSPTIFKINQTGKIIELTNKSDTNDTSLKLSGLNSNYAQVGVDGKKLYLVHNGSNVLITDSNNGILCTRGVSGGSASTANRPAAVTVGTMFYDTTLGKPIWYSGGNQWVDATGHVV